MKKTFSVIFISLVLFMSHCGGTADQTTISGDTITSEELQQQGLDQQRLDESVLE